MDRPFLYASITSLLHKLQPVHLQKLDSTTISDAIDVKLLRDALTSLLNALLLKKFDDYYPNTLNNALYDFHDSLDEYVYLTSAERYSPTYQKQESADRFKDLCLRRIRRQANIITRDIKSFPLKDKEKYLQSFSTPSMSSEFNVEELPPHLVPCLAYCSLYPKNITFVREILVNQWLAEGFLSSTKGDEELEQIGNRYFDELCVRGVFQAPIFAFGENTQTLQEPSRVFSCVMHPLAHELACNLSHKEVSIFDRRNMDHAEVLGGGRFVTFHKNGLSKVNYHTAAMNCGQAITFISFNPHWDVFVPDTAFKFSNLRVLDLSGCCFEVLPDMMRDRKLRYLGLSRNKQLKRLDLRSPHLQTLLVDGCLRLNVITLDESCITHLYLTTKQINVELWMSLQVLELFQCLELRSLGGIRSSTLRILRIFECPRIDLLDYFEVKTCLEELVLHKCATLDLGRVERVKLPRLKYLELIG